MTTLITGATRGVGRALLETFAASGEEVIGTYRGTAPTGAPGRWLPAEMTDPASIAAIGRALDGAPLDLLVLNAGIYSDKGERLGTGFPPDLWAKMFAVNAIAPFLTIQTLLPNLRAAKGAKIAILSSQMASTTNAPGGSYIYRASKAAVLNIGRNLAAELKPEGMSVGIYHPGWVRTDMGGPGAAIDADAAARGLIERFTALSPRTTGCFETWDGRAHPV